MSDALLASDNFYQLYKQQINKNIMRFITQKMHAFIDYPVAIALIVLPFVLGLGESNPLALQLSVATGSAAFILTLLTDHETGIASVVSYKLHLIVDFLVGVVFIAAPFVLGFEGIDALFYWINGAAVLTVVSLQQPATASQA